jgi:predicted MFS family arabinose efflux permease
MAALAGFVSKAGLATGPLVGSMFILNYGFEMILNIATIALIGATLLITYSSSKQKEAV